MTKSKMGQGQQQKLKADYGRDKTSTRGPEERREVARRKPSSKKSRTGKSFNK